MPPQPVTRMRDSSRPFVTAVVISCLLTGLPGAGHAGPSDASTRLNEMFESGWERMLRENPLAATYLGDPRYDAQWPDRSPAALERMAAGDRATIAALDALPADQLSAADRLNRDLFRRGYVESVEAYEYGEPYLALNHMEGVQTEDQLVELLQFGSPKDYENWLARLQSVGTYVDQNVALLRAGAARGLVQPAIIMQRVPAQVAVHLVDDPTRSKFYRPFVTMPDTISAAEQARLRAAAAEAIRTAVVPAYRRLQDYLVGEYLPKCRDTVGIWDTPGGEDWYRKRIRAHTTTELTADRIHQIGLAEVERIRGEMQRIVDRVGFAGSLQDFMQHLRTDPRFRYRDPQQLLTAYTVMAKRIDPLLPQYFGKLPRMPYGVRPIPEHAAPDTTTAYYQGPSVDGRRAGYYYVNLYKPEERPTYEIPVLTVHEAMPGHHLQIALAQELGELPMFRRNSGFTAFVEGWALYSESLGTEMGLYDDPYDKFGQLTYEMWRAVRLVVDTGMHEKRWTRQQAIDFFKANAAKTELDIVNEIDRYIAWPGQALAYKVGELTIKELREESRKVLGDRFDLREFHDVVLGSGAVPLDVLKHNVLQWQQRPQ
jgi:uncharacterized protein (DUF885 family)